MMYNLYDAPLYRPPSEAYSLILQITLGCSHNRCVFCNMYKTKRFYVKDPMEIEEHIKAAKLHNPKATRIFLADGNVMSVETGLLVEIVQRLYREFPYLERVSAYAGPLDLLDKSMAELKQIKEAGLEMLYLGVESGSKRVLTFMNKGVTPEEMIIAGQKAKESGFTLSCTVISGLGGKELWEEHAIETARVINAINPDYFALLTLLVEEDAPLKHMISKGRFELLTPEEVIQETYLMFKNLELNQCTFRSNHPSNYLPLAGELNRDKGNILRQLEEALNQDNKALTPEAWRRL